MPATLFFRKDSIKCLFVVSTCVYLSVLSNKMYVKHLKCLVLFQMSGAEVLNGM